MELFRSMAVLMMIVVSLHPVNSIIGLKAIRDWSLYPLMNVTEIGEGEPSLLDLLKPDSSSPERSQLRAHAALTNFHASSSFCLSQIGPKRGRWSAMIQVAGLQRDIG